MDKPEHLRPETTATTPRRWLAARPAACAAVVLGLLSFIVAAVSQGELWSTPDPRISVPGLAVTAVAAGISLVRREPKGYLLWCIGLGLAAAAVVLGYFLMLAIVVAVTAVVLLILNAVM